jgi:hypothetical protein
MNAIARIAPAYPTHFSCWRSTAEADHAACRNWRIHHGPCFALGHSAPRRWRSSTADRVSGAPNLGLRSAGLRGDSEPVVRGSCFCSTPGNTCPSTGRRSFSTISSPLAGSLRWSSPSSIRSMCGQCAPTRCIPTRCFRCSWQTSSSRGSRGAIGSTSIHRGASLAAPALAAWPLRSSRSTDQRRSGTSSRSPAHSGRPVPATLNTRALRERSRAVRNSPSVSVLRSAP